MSASDMLAVYAMVLLAPHMKKEGALWWSGGYWVLSFVLIVVERNV